MSSDSIFIRPVAEHEEFEAIENIQRVVWGIHDNSDLVPAHLLITAQHNGGLVLGAFTADGTAAGFVFGFLGSASDDRSARMGMAILHCSHMMGVLPEYRGKSLGYRLKTSQRECVLKQGLKLIIWTFDPLLVRNATLNITQLGGICRYYIPNLYGDLREELNAGLPTDRFEIEWWIDTERVKNHLALPGMRADAAGWRLSGAPAVNRTSRRDDGQRIPEGWEPVNAPHFMVEVPNDFQTMRAVDRDLALQWRLHTREIFSWGFGNGYGAAWVAMEKVDGEPRAYYVLTNQLDNILPAAGGTDAR
jgi:predicted GNAT superfamily acetyltransferase